MSPDHSPPRACIHTPKPCAARSSTTNRLRKRSSSLATLRPALPMSEARRSGDGQPDDSAVLGFLRAIAGRDGDETSRMLASMPALAVAVVRAGATRQDPDTYFLTAIKHHVYAGDTALHVAAAAYQRAT